MSKPAKPDSTRAPAEVMRATASSCAQIQPVGKPPPVQSDQTIEDFAEFEGTTSFGRASSSATNRYKLSLRSGKLRIWLEDCETKNQWCTSELSLESYVNPNNAVPYATALEYVENFHVLLGAIVEDAEDILRAFKRTKGNSFLLEISVQVQVLTRVRVVTYSFDMEPISVERIDVLESRVRDLRDEVKALKAGGSTAVAELQGTVKNLEEELSCRRTEISDLQRKIKDIEAVPLTVEARATSKIPGNVLCWSAVGNYSNGSDGIIRNLQPGTYHVTAVVNYAASDYGQTLQLKSGGRIWQLVYCTFIRSHYTSGVLARTITVGEGDQLSVVCTANEVDCDDGCYLTLTRVGN